MTLPLTPGPLSKPCHRSTSIPALIVSVLSRELLYNLLQAATGGLAFNANGMTRAFFIMTRVSTWYEFKADAAVGQKWVSKTLAYKGGWESFAKYTNGM